MTRDERRRKRAIRQLIFALIGIPVVLIIGMAIMKSGTEKAATAISVKNK